MKLRVTTWNLDRSHKRGKWRIEEQQRALEAQAADVYLLTEVDERFKVANYPAFIFRTPALAAMPPQSMPLEFGPV